MLPEGEDVMKINWSSVIGIALWALIPGFVARKKGRSFAAYYFLSFLITPLITMIVALCVKDLNKAAVDKSALIESRMTGSHEDK